MSELPPQQPRPESQKIILPHEFTDEEKRRFGGTSYHSYEDYDERAGAQAEREYTENTGPESVPKTPDDTPEPPASERPTTRMDAIDPSEPESDTSVPEEDLDETTEMPKVEKEDDETPEERRERIMREIDEADRMKRPTKRMRTLKRIAYEAQASGDLDLAIDAASRIRTSKVRKEGGLSQLWIRNTLAHDQVMSDLAENIDFKSRKLEVAEHIKFGYKRNPVMAAVIRSAYDEANQSFQSSDKKFKESDPDDRHNPGLIESALLEDEGRTREKEAKKLTAERLRGWQSSKYFGETLAYWAVLRKDPEMLTALGSIRHFLRKRRAKRDIEKSKKNN